MRTDRERFLDILEAIEKIERHIGRGKLAFEKDEFFQVWVMHQLQVIGEAASRVSESIQVDNTQIPWGKMIGMRHILVHGYFETDLEIVWSVIEKDIAPLKTQIQKLLSMAE